MRPRHRSHDGLKGAGAMVIKSHTAGARAPSLPAAPMSELSDSRPSALVPL
jgi:hypothetical protein